MWLVASATVLLLVSVSVCESLHPMCMFPSTSLAGGEGVEIMSYPYSLRCSRFEGPFGKLLMTLGGHTWGRTAEHSGG